MALQQINGNQISDLTDATITSLRFKNTNSVLQLPTGTEAQRPSGVAYGTMRFNTTQDKVEVYVTNSNGQGADGWTLVGAGGPHVGNKDTSYIRTNSASIDENITIGPVANGGNQFTNAMVAGPVEIASGYTVTVESGAAFYVIGEDADNAAYEDVNVYGILSVPGRLDITSTREHMHTYRVGLQDTMLNIDYNNHNIIYVNNVSQNFNINVLNLPTASIGTGGTDANKAYGFTIMYYNSNPAYRPTGTIYVNGSSIGSARWSGGSPPSTLATSREVTVGLSIVRVTEVTNDTGGTSTVWKAYIQFTEFA